uniref:Choline transporter-like protein n=1 Tax=Angiostrongylus cantonensis TaxID=6313 RepID=A0A0K0D3G1_ANGCA
LLSLSFGAFFRAARKWFAYSKEHHWLMVFYQFLGFVWVSEFLMACQRLFIAGAVSMYYFDVLSMSRRFASTEPRSPVRSSLFNLLRYHLGSAALGAFIIVLVRVPRYVVIWSLSRMRSVENVIIKKILSVFICILSCIENCLQYINYNVFTVISYSGFSFCPAAKMAINHLLDNAVDVAALNSVGDMVLFLTKCLVAFATTFCAFLRMEEIANCLLSVYEMAIDTIMLCCAEELVLLRDNPEMAQQFRDYIDGTSEMTQRNVRFLGSSAIEETYPLGTISNEEQK